MCAVETSSRVQVIISGIVQGVGFRPFVRNLAVRSNLTGFVRNADGTVEIEVEGPDHVVAVFLEDLQREAPPLSAIESLRTRTIATRSDATGSFHIVHSSAGDPHSQRFISADAATCNDCLAELFDADDRRFRYPFINCTNCGPRFTIISTLPYDRQNTTMAPFQMCEECQGEYDDSSDRRYHAQPNACSNCGPALSFSECGQVRYYREEALAAAVEALQRSTIIAVKGLGGFHLICDATDAVAVNKLRQRKGRGQKPFAVMMQNKEMAARYCRCSDLEMQELNSVARPIVLLDKLDPFALPDELSPNIRSLGVMLPYTPLHHLLLADFGRPIVATSANRSEEPIVIDNGEALEKLSDIADGFLLHDRQIKCRYDDSVVQVAAGHRNTIRRSRGFAPVAIRLPFASTKTVLACGAHLKNTVCFVRGNQAFLSQHIGDMENLETYQYFEELVQTYVKLFDLKPDLIAHDLHPDYSSTRLAQSLSSYYGAELQPVQHHFAHIVSCMAEHKVKETAIGVAFDGIGFGADGTLWGGEFLIAGLNNYQRAAHLETVPMPGGARAIMHPWRMALGYILGGSQSSIDLFSPLLSTMTERHGQVQIHAIQKQIERELNAPLTSSCGRLFDAMAMILGVCDSASYEAEAAMQLEAIAEQAINDARASATYPYEFVNGDQATIIRVRSILAEAYRDRLAGVPVGVVGARFHHTIARLVCDTCIRLRESSGIQSVCLSGGVFQNKLLLRLCCEQLDAAQFQVFFPQRAPANDGGISLGQAVAALAIAEDLTEE